MYYASPRAAVRRVLEKCARCEALDRRVQLATYNAATFSDLFTAISNSNASGTPGGDTIQINANIRLTSALPAITRSVTIQGNNFTLSGDANNSGTRNAGDVRVLLINPSAAATVTINNLTIADGYAAGGDGGDGATGGGGGAGFGGGIAAFGSGLNLTLNNCVLRNNLALGGRGGDADPLKRGSGGGGGSLFAAGGAGVLTTTNTGFGGGGGAGTIAGANAVGTAGAAGGGAGAGSGGQGGTAASLNALPGGNGSGLGAGGGGGSAHGSVGASLNGDGGSGGNGAGGGGAGRGTGAVAHGGAGGWGGGGGGGGSSTTYGQAGTYGGRGGTFTGGGGAGLGAGLYFNGANLSILSTDFLNNRAQGGSPGSNGVDFGNAAGGKGVAGGVFAHVSATSATIDGSSSFSGNVGTQGADDYEGITFLAPLITLQPLSQSVGAGTDVELATNAYGYSSVQWQLSTNNGVTFNNINTATSPTLSLPAVTISMNGYRYRAVYTSGTGSTTSSVAILTVTAVPAITSSPSSLVMLPGTVANFFSTATGSPTPTPQWQVSTDSGAHWTDISGGNTSSYSVITSLALDGNQYRAVWTNSVGSSTSGVATLSVKTLAAPDPLDLQASADTGVSSSDNITRAATLAFVVPSTVFSSATITLLRDGVVRSTRVGPGTITDSSVGEGTHLYTITQTIGGNTSAASTPLEVEVDRTGPATIATTFSANEPAGGAPQAYRWTFSEDVGASLAQGDFAMYDLNNPAAFNTNPAIQYDSTTQTVILTFPASTRFGVQGVLPDATFFIYYNRVADAAGNLGAFAPKQFSFLAGDLDANGTVAFDDLLIVAQNYGTTGRTYSEGNIDYSADGLVGFDDLLVLAQQYGNSSLKVADGVKQTRKDRMTLFA